MQTLFILEYQAMNDGHCAMTPPLSFQVSNVADENAVIARFFSVCAAAAESSCDTHTVEITDSEGDVWRGYRQVLRHARDEI